jgi:DNA-binding NarL/FixJ family response regulator
MSTPAALSVIVADDSLLFRDLLVEGLRSRGVEVLGEAADLPGTLELVDRVKPDVAVLDVRMPPSGTDEGAVAAGVIRQQGPAVMLLSQHVETATAADVIEACGGGIGYLLKDRVADLDELVGKLLRVRDGDVVLDPEVVSRLLARRRHNDPVDRLTPAQRSVLELVAEGRTNSGIAEALCISERTVETHVRDVFDALGLDRAPAVHRRVMAAVTYLRRSD